MRKECHKSHKPFKYDGFLPKMFTTSANQQSQYDSVCWNCAVRLQYYTKVDKLMPAIMLDEPLEWSTKWRTFPPIVLRVKSTQTQMNLKKNILFWRHRDTKLLIIQKLRAEHSPYSDVVRVDRLKGKKGTSLFNIKRSFHCFNVSYISIEVFRKLMRIKEVLMRRNLSSDSWMNFWAAKKFIVLQEM